MRVFSGRKEFDRAFPRPIVTVGNFDGLHQGHRAILDTVVRRAHDLAGQAVVYTFEPHPRKVLHPDRPLGLLTTPDQKRELLADVGVDGLIIEPFDRLILLTRYADYAAWANSRYWRPDPDPNASDALEKFRERRRITVDTVVYTTRLCVAPS